MLQRNDPLYWGHTDNDMFKTCIAEDDDEMQEWDWYYAEILRESPSASWEDRLYHANSGLLEWRAGNKE